MRGFALVVRLGSVFACTALCSAIALADARESRAADTDDEVRSAQPAEPEVVREEPAPRMASRRRAGAGRSEVKDDVVIVRYPNRHVKIKKHVTMDADGNFINHGDWIMRDPHGNVIATGRFEQGKRHGNWSRLQPQPARHFDSPLYRGFTRPFAWETTFENDVLHGAWDLIDADGRPMRTWEFDRGRLHGKSVVWFPSGRKRHEISYRHGLAHGAAREWHANGKMMSTTHFVAGRRNKRVIKRHPNGKVASEGWMRGPKESVRVTFNWWEGSVETKMIPSKGKGVRQDTWIHRFANGARKYQGRFDDDRPVGVHTWWHANGNKRMEGQFVDGKEQGPWTWWHANGHKSRTGDYLAGQKIGNWTNWDEAGKIVKRIDQSVRTNETEAKPAPSERTVSRPKRISSRGTAKPAPRVSHRFRGPLSRQGGEDMPEILKQWRARNGGRLR